jgi:uncharacterized protein (TIGR00369 family)
LAVFPTFKANTTEALLEERMTKTAENLTPLAHSAQNRCFGCGVANPVGLHLEFMLADDHSVVCLAEIPDTFEGPRGYLHGGIIATLLDEAMSKAVRVGGVIAMTRNMEVDYLRPVPSGNRLRLEGRVIRSEGRKHWVEAKILSAEGTTLAHGKGLFIEVKPR